MNETDDPSARSWSLSSGQASVEQSLNLSPKAKRYIKIALTIALLGALLLTLDVSRFSAALFRVDAAWMALGVALCFVFVAARMLKWVFLARANGLVAPPLDLVRAMAFALALGIVTPGRVGEVAALAPFSSEQRPRALLTYIFDRVGELATVLMFCAPAALLFLPGWGLPVAAALFLGSIGIVLIVQVPALRRVIAAQLPKRTPARLREVLGSVVLVPSAYWLLSLGAYFITYASIAAFIAGSEPITNPQVFVLLPPVTLSNLITITIGGLGLREGLAALLAPVGGVAPEVGAAAFFLSFFWTRLVPGLLGLGWTLARTLRPQNGGE